MTDSHGKSAGDFDRTNLAPQGSRGQIQKRTVPPDSVSSNPCHTLYCRPAPTPSVW